MDTENRQPPDRFTPNQLNWNRLQARRCSVSRSFAHRHGPNDRPLDTADADTQQPLVLFISTLVNCTRLGPSTSSGNFVSVSIYHSENDQDIWRVHSIPMGLLPNTENGGLRMRRECRERFPRHRLQRKPLTSDPGMHHGTCVTHVP